LPYCRNRADVLLNLLTILVNRADKLCGSQIESTFFLDFLVPAELLPDFATSAFVNSRFTYAAMALIVRA
jgi:hypothetical protein